MCQFYETVGIIIHIIENTIYLVSTIVNTCTHNYMYNTLQVSTCAMQFSTEQLYSAHNELIVLATAGYCLYVRST